jgi:hypothetical protein
MHLNSAYLDSDYNKKGVGLSLAPALLAKILKANVRMPVLTY